MIGTTNQGLRRYREDSKIGQAITLEDEVGFSTSPNPPTLLPNAVPFMEAMSFTRGSASWARR